MEEVKKHRLVDLKDKLGIYRVVCTETMELFERKRKPTKCPNCKTPL